MSRLKRAALVARLAKRKEDQAAELLRLWRQRVTAQSDQLQELHRYQQAYLDAARATQQTLHELQANRQFLTQLDKVVTEQTQRLAQMEQQFSAYCQQWQSLHQRRKMLESYQDRLAAEAQQELDRQWDKLCDELAARPRTTDH